MSEGNFLGSLTEGTWVALPVSPISDYTEHPFAFSYFDQSITEDHKDHKTSSP